MSKPLPRIAYLTAGAAGMFCGSCLHDNTLARALTQLGVDVQLIPTYTPIRTDEPNQSVPRVFLGGVNVFLDQALPGFRWLPNWATRWLDYPAVIRFATARGASTQARFLGGLAISMLRGEAGYQRREISGLCEYLRGARPDIVVLSNALIAGCVPALRRELGVPILITLQGDDVFLESLPAPFREQALAEIRRLAEYVPGFVVQSEYYAHFMSHYLRLPRDKMHLAPLGIDTSDFAHLAPRAERPPTVGYLARLAPEKGLHLLVEAFIELRRRPGLHQTRLKIAGWLGAEHKAFVANLFRKLQAAGLGDAFDDVGEVSRRGKIEFLNSIDVLSVPTTYHDPKGLFVLEALAAGVPVVQPAHGAFPELLAATGGGRLFEPGNTQHLVAELADLLTHGAEREALGQRGRAKVLESFTAPVMAERTLAVFCKAANFEFNATRLRPH